MTPAERRVYLAAMRACTERDSVKLGAGGSYRYWNALDALWKACASAERKKRKDS